VAKLIMITELNFMKKRTKLYKILFDYQKRVLRLNRIFKLYNILQKIKDRKNEQNEGCNK
jgi:hypothetical protein